MPNALESDVLAAPPRNPILRLARRLLANLARLLRPGSRLALEAGWEQQHRRALEAERQGRYSDLEQILAEADSLARCMRGARCALALSDLGGWYQNLLGRFPKAESLYLEAVELLERELGREHARLAIPLNSLVLLYHDQRRFDEEEQLLERLLPLVENALGNDHPDYAVCLENYAALLRQTDRAEEAARVRERAESVRAKHSLS